MSVFHFYSLLNKEIVVENCLEIKKNLLEHSSLSNCAYHFCEKKKTNFNLRTLESLFCQIPGFFKILVIRFVNTRSIRLKGFGSIRNFETSIFLLHFRIVQDLKNIL